MPQHSNNRNHESVLAAAVIGIGILAAVAAVWLSDPFGKRGGGADALDADVWADKRHIPAERIGYRQTASISVDLDGPMALALGPADERYIGGSSEIRVFSADGTELRRWSTGHPVRALAADEAGRVYAAASDRLVVYRSTGERLFDSPPLPGDPLLSSVAVGPATVYLADSGNAAVCRVNPDDGRILGWIGRNPETGVGEPFVIRSLHLDVAVDADGDLWTAHCGRFSIEHRTADGELLGAWGSSVQNADDPLAGFAGCCNPTDIALHGTAVFTSEKGIERVKHYHRDGHLETIVAPPAEFTAGTEGLDLAVARDGAVVVLDPNRKRVVEYRRKTPKTQPKPVER